MHLPPQIHQRTTERLALALRPKQIYEWLCTTGYFPEPFVLPPCFCVTKRPEYGARFFPYTTNEFRPRIAQYLPIQFPKSNYTDRTFSIVDPELHSDIALTIAQNWKKVVGLLFDPANKVCSYSFPIPVTSRAKGIIGNLRSGRMIYEFIEMAENDIASMAYRFSVLAKTDVKNFYPSLYSHSLPWALHGKKLIRKDKNRFKMNFFGNRLDKLFQNLSDGCTNGIPIGPAISDIASEVVLAAVDKSLGPHLTDDVCVVRFKDDYRILATSEQAAKDTIKELQRALREYRLELNDEKTQFHQLPSGLFREWVSGYHAANPRPKTPYSYRRFKEAYLAVVNIDRLHPGCGVIDRFLADIVNKRFELRVHLDKRSLPKVISLLLMLGRLRTKAFPKVLAIIEAALKTPTGITYRRSIAEHLWNLLDGLRKKEADNRYLIAWICYFLKSNDMLKGKPALTFTDPIVRATYTSRFTEFRKFKRFKVFMGVKSAARKYPLLPYLDVFRPQ